MPPADPDLARVIDAWPTLPEATRQAVLRLIDDTTAARARSEKPNVSANGSDTFKRAERRTPDAT